MCWRVCIIEDGFRNTTYIQVAVLNCFNLVTNISQNNASMIQRTALDDSLIIVDLLECICKALIMM